MVNSELKINIIESFLVNSNQQVQVTYILGMAGAIAKSLVAFERD